MRNKLLLRVYMYFAVVFSQCVSVQIIQYCYWRLKFSVLTSTTE